MTQCSGRSGGPGGPAGPAPPPRVAGPRVPARGHGGAPGPNKEVTKQTEECEAEADQNRSRQQGCDQNLKTAVVVGTDPLALTRACTFLRDCDIIRLSGVAVASPRMLWLCRCYRSVRLSLCRIIPSAGILPAPPRPPPLLHHLPVGPVGPIRTLKPPPVTGGADESSREKEHGSQAQSALNASPERCARVWLAPVGGGGVQARTERLGPSARRHRSDAWI